MKSKQSRPSGQSRKHESSFPGELSRIDRERRLLQFLCQNSQNNREGSILAQDTLLGDYTWIEPLHRVIFEAIRSSPARSPQVLQVQLPAMLTRRGYPDVDLDPFFEPHGLTQAEVERFMKELKECQP